MKPSDIFKLVDSPLNESSNLRHMPILTHTYDETRHTEGHAHNFIWLNKDFNISNKMKIYIHHIYMMMNE